MNEVQFINPAVKPLSARHFGVASSEVGSVGGWASPGQAIVGYRNVFGIGDYYFYVDEHEPAEVMLPASCAWIPFTEEWCLGLTSFRSDLVPVFDIAPLLNPEKPADPSSGLFLILGQNDARGGLRIDWIKTVAVSQNPIESPASQAIGEIPLQVFRTIIEIGTTPYYGAASEALFTFLCDRAGVISSS